MTPTIAPAPPVTTLAPPVVAPPRPGTPPRRSVDTSPWPTSEGDSPKGRLEPLHGTRSGKRSGRRSSGAGFFLVTFAAYAAIGMVLTMHFNLVDPDGPSRVANAGYVLFSRDPHLGAVGFVWNPIPSLAELPLLLFSHLWPPLMSQGQAGTIMAAAFMAGAAWQVRAITVDRGLPSLWRWIIVAGFALNPMIILYGGNGMSEAPYIFFTLWAVRRLLRWMRTDQVNDLVVAGIAFGLDYLTRYEAAVAVIGAVAVVMVVATLRGAAHDHRERIKRAAVDATVLAFPFVVCFIGWTIASWVTTGIAFSQFSSRYGNSSQVLNASTTASAAERLAHSPITVVIQDTFHLEPLLPILVIVVLVLAVRRTDLDSLVPLAVFGGVLGFEAFALVSGMTFPLFRYFIMAVPLMIVLITLLWPYRGVPAPPQPRVRAKQVALRKGTRLATRKGTFDRVFAAVTQFGAHLTNSSRRRRVLGLCLVVLFLVPSIPLAWSGLTNRAIGTQWDQYGLRTVLSSDRYPVQMSPLRNNVYVANYVDRLGLPEGSVLMDTYIGWDIWLNSNNHKQFVITSDYDFAAALNAPYASGIRYILVSDPAQDGSADAINLRYPTMYRDGAGIGSLVMTVPGTGDLANWRLYRVNPP
jgi:hypothetical protein